MPNLYTDDLSNVCVDEVARFLSLDSPDPGLRPTEGVRLDFKLDLPQALGETVAALSNTYGGLILLGVASIPGQKNVPGSLPGTTLGNDPKARVADKVLASVYPRPNFEVHVMSAKSAGKHVVVIRVHEGTFPPYEFSQGSTIKIPVRVEDSDRQASVRDIERLFRRRQERTPAPSETETTYLMPLVGLVSIPSSGGPIRRFADVNRFGMVLIPTGGLDFQLDLNAEKHLESLIWATFKGDREFYRAQNFERWQKDWQVRGELSDFEFRIDDEKAPCDRIWRFWSNGALGFATNHSRIKVPESVGNLVSDSLRFCRMATRFLEEKGYFGSLVFAQNLQCPSRKFEASFPGSARLMEYDAVPGITFPEQISAPRDTGSIYTHRTDWESARRPVDLVTSAMVFHLREIAGASVDSEKLRQQTGLLLRYFESKVWGKPEASGS